MRRAIANFRRSLPAWAAIFALAASLLLFSPAAAVHAGEEGLGTVAGVVINVSGSPVAGARVTLQGADGSSPQTTQTNSKGRFFFPQLVHGYYDVRAYSNGEWSSWKHNVEVKIGKQTELKLQVIPPKKTSS